MKQGIDESALKAKHSEQADELRRQLAEKDRILKGYKSSHGKLELFFDDLRSVIKPIPPIAPYVSNSSVGNSENVAVFHLSDGHLGSVQNPDEIEGFNEFNIAICRERSLKYIHRGVDTIQRMRLAYKIKDCVVLVTGDMISGDIHDELKITNEVTLPVQAVMAGDLLAEQLAILAEYFENVTVHFLTEDNHSRLTKKPQAKEAGLNSMNYVVGYVAKIRTDLMPNVDFNIYPQYEKVVNVNGRKYLMMHGHSIVGWMGLPWYSIERKIAKESTARMQLMMDDMFNKSNEIGFHKLVMGHYHTPLWHPLFIMSGSVQGTDAYDHKAGRHSDPSQSMWLVHPKHGEFGRIDFNLKY